MKADFSFKKLQFYNLDQDFEQYNIKNKTVEYTQLADLVGQWSFNLYWTKGHILTTKMLEGQDIKANVGLYM